MATKKVFYSAVGAWIPNIQIPNIWKCDFEWVYFQMVTTITNQIILVSSYYVKNKMTAILFSFWIVRLFVFCMAFEYRAIVFCMAFEYRAIHQCNNIQPSEIRTCSVFRPVLHIKVVKSLQMTLSSFTCWCILHRILALSPCKRSE